MFKLRDACFLMFLFSLQDPFCHAKETNQTAIQSVDQSGHQDDSCAGHATLNGFERAQFLEVAMGQRPEVLAQFLAAPGCSERMLEGLRSLDTTVRYSDERSGYALITISKDKLLDTLDLPGIAYAYTRDDERMYYQDPAAKVSQSEREPKPEPVPAITIPYPRVATTLAPDGPYFDTDAIGLTALWKEHPDADGRGVRVAVSDMGFDLLHPALQQARDAGGNLIPKVADLGVLTTPEEDSGWVRFGDPVQVGNGGFEAAGRTWTVPEEGTYRFGIFKQDLVLGPEDNSHSKKLSLAVGVLWDQQSGRVWVDTDGDGSFKNQRALGDYGVTHGIDWFGTKEGEDDNRIPFGVKIDPEQNAVYIRIGGYHGAMVAGPLAANTLTGGLFNGAAPSAQLIDTNEDANRLPAIVRSFARSDSDVVNRSGGIARVESGKGEGSEDFQIHVLERLSAVYDKPMACYCSANGTIFVNDYASAEMLRRNRQLGPPYRDTINSFITPMASGFVNTVLAPSANLETQSRYAPLDIRWSDGRLHSFRDNSFDPPAPDGYWTGANNSPTIPVVSGLLADLISEARHEHVRYNATRLNDAVFTGARLLEGIPVSQQGYGLINGAQSWDQLSKMADADDPNNPELTSFTFSTPASAHSVDMQGFQADLPHPGEKLTGEIWITRHGGYAAGRKYTFSLRGNNGSFELLDHEATLERKKPTQVRFRTNGESGWNIVFLELRDAKANVVMQDVPLSVRVPEVPERVAPGVDKYEFTIQPLRSEYGYVRIDEDVQAARYVMRIPYTGPDNISTRFAPGLRYNTTTTPPGQSVDAAHHVGPMETPESLVANDEPGTQEIYWENFGRPEYATEYDGPAPDAPIHAELAVSKYAVAMEKGANDTLSVTNKLAEIDGKVEIYDASLTTSQVTGTGLHASSDIERTLPANLTQWRVRVTSGASSAEPADVYLLDCSSKRGCYTAAHQEINSPGTTIVIDKPQAGDWKIVVRSRNQQQNPVTYAVREALLVPAPTPIEPMDSNHASGTTWSLPLPAKRSDAQYAAFRIAGTPENKREKSGLLIAMTPLQSDAP